MELKYGCNPHQKPASYRHLNPESSAFEVLGGNPGYINLLDAVNAWQLVVELKRATGMTAATSFKHVSPAGAALGVQLDDRLRRAYEAPEGELTPAACAYLRARGADPSSSFGDFIALSDKVDDDTARVIAGVVSDGIIAPDYSDFALEKLRAKKKGSFIVLKANPDYVPPDVERREIFGVEFSQARNASQITKEHVSKAAGAVDQIPDSAKLDMILGLVTLKYTQSNSTGYALNGQMIGIGAGQQSRVDCTKLAGRKADVWRLRLHDKVLGLKFREGVKKQERINWRLRLVEGDLTEGERSLFKELIEGDIPELADAEKASWIQGMTGVSFVSDAFLPFRDNVDHASRHGVKYIVHTGGSLRDEDVTRAADEYGIAMIHSGIRLFHH